MAKIELTGFVGDWTKNEPQHPAWGMKVNEPHRKETNGAWETLGYTYHTLKVSHGSGIDLTQFSIGDRVKISGNQVTQVSEKDGVKYRNLIVWADSVSLVMNYGINASPIGSSTPVATIPDEWQPVDADTPF